MTTVEIPLTHGYVAIVDAADAEQVSTRAWSARVDGRNVYAVIKVRTPQGSRRLLGMHTFLTGHGLVDHINGNGLDNRRSNLRSATTAENQRNARRRSDNTSGFKGVHWDAAQRRWKAQISVGGKRLSRGRYPTAEDAARAYDRAARELHGEFATLNFPAPGERAAGRS